MKMKKLLIVGIILTVMLTLGAVSANELNETLSADTHNDLQSNDIEITNEGEKQDIDLNIEVNKEYANYREGYMYHDGTIYHEDEDEEYAVPLELLVDGNETEIISFDMDYIVFDTSKLDLGEHTYTLNYLGSKHYNPASVNGTFWICEIAVNAPEKYTINSYGPEPNSVDLLLPSNMTGEVTVTVAGESQTKEIEADESPGGTYVSFWLGKYSVPCGESDITVMLNDEIIRTYKLITDYIMYPSQEVRYGKDKFTVDLPIGMDETLVSVSIDGEVQDMEYEIRGDGAYNGARFLSLDIAKQFSVGNHTVMVTFAGDEMFSKKSFEGAMMVIPVISVESNSMNGDNITLYMPDDAEGNVEIWLTYLEEETLKPYKYATVKAAGDVYIPLENLSVGSYAFDYKYTGSDGYKIYSNDQFFTINPTLIYPKEFAVGDDVEISIDYGNYSGILVVSDSDYLFIGNATLINGKASVSLKNAVLREGEQELIVNLEGTYINDDGDEITYYYNYYLKVNVAKPAIALPPSKIMLGDNAKVSIDLPGFKGQLIVRERVKEGEGKAADLENGKADVEVIKLTEGKRSYYAHLMLEKTNYDGEIIYEEYSWDFDIDVVNPITAKDAAVLYSASSTYKAQIKDITGKPVTSGKATFYIMDGKKQILKKTVNIKKGVATLTFKITSAPKVYTIKTVYNKASVSKKLTVKSIVALKAVTVKKSAKKLVLQATLKKVNGKYLKSKAVTFKFNGKTYKAKTNSKGIAKVTIKSSVLKKLKVGKKITYQATYLKDTVQKTAKVKR
ncbi:hypothetical protein [Methanobrevibacter sp.]|uniref:hypothetical protein n=1 Tax=Methanobrevibacter sp. TaxID=66852 RepID=UPI00388E0E89